MRIVLVTIDCLRADVLSKMPNLRKIGENFVAFNCVYSNGGHTCHSLKSFLTSSYPSDYDYMKYKVPSFVQKLKNSGYSTACFHSNPWMKIFEPSFGRGFDIFKNFGLIGVLPTASCKIVLKNTYDWISKKQKEKKDYFAWIHLMDAHASVHYDDKGENYIERYFKGIKCIDNVISEIAEWGDLVIITADHGEELGERTRRDKRIFGHSHEVLTQELLRIPLIIKSNENEKMKILRKKKNRRTSLLNLAPTILDFVCAEIPKTFRGKSLLKQDLFVDEIVVAERPWPMRIPEGEDYTGILRAYICGNQKIVVNFNKKKEIKKVEYEVLKKGD